MFLALRKYMENCEAKPDAAWFENVAAVLKQSKSHVDTAADKIMSGVQNRPNGKKPIWIWLEVPEEI